MPADTPAAASTRVAETLATEFFGDLQRGQSAPDWLVSAVATGWELGADLQLNLISVSENASFLARSAGEPVAVLRLNRPGYLAGESAVQSEAAWVSAIAAAGDVTVAAPLMGVTGQHVQKLADGDAENGQARYTGMMSPFVAGSILEDVAEPGRWFPRIGRDTALLHDHARQWQPPAGFDRFDWDLQHMLGDGARWGRWQDMPLTDAQLALLTRAEEAARAVLAGRMRKSADTWGLIHADIRPSNVIVDGDTLTVIDFDDCGRGWFLYDFASAMTWLDHLPQAPGLAQDWFAGYREVRPRFGRDDALVACALDLVRSLTMLGWCSTHRQEAQPELVRGQVAETTCLVAEAYLRSPSWLLD